MKRKFDPFKILFILCLFVLTVCQNAIAQNIADAQKALSLIQANSAKIGFTEADIANSRISDTYVDALSGATLVYVQQTFQGIDVDRSIKVLAFKDDNVVSALGERFAGKQMKANPAAFKATAAVSAFDAVNAATIHLKMPPPPMISALTEKQDASRETSFGNMGISTKDIKAKLVWITGTGSQEMQLCWIVEIAPAGTTDFWRVKVDAQTGTVIGKDNYTVNCNWNKKHIGPDQYFEKENVDMTVPSLTAGGAADAPPPPAPPINSATYNAVPFPIEAPSFPGGTPAIQTDPWKLSPAGSPATTLTWNSDGTNDYDSTRGNNVLARVQHSTADNSATNAGIGAHSTTAVPDLTFNSAANFTVQPNTDSTFQRFSATNLFYWNNIMHDMSYQYGFDEPSGNFQANNQGRGGIGGDYIYAFSQYDNGQNGNLDNSNFVPAVDGTNGIMHMFLFSGVVSGILRINSPADIAGTMTAVEDSLSTKNKLRNVGPVTADIVYYNEADIYHNACAVATNAAALKGKIALINRSTCTFVTKMDNAQAAGAIGVIMVDSVVGQSPIIMGGSDNTITIPGVMISQADGQRIKTEFDNGAVNATLSSGAVSVMLDGAIDEGVVSHEYTHGISNRLTGGPSTVSCLNNAEQMGEGWSDYDALMITTNWATAKLTDGPNPRPLGTYVLGEVPSGPGIRIYPYSTDFAVDPHTYADVSTYNGEVHDIGEVWTSTLWDMTWDIIQQDGKINTNFFDASAAGGNTVAMKLMYEGLKLQPCSPGFIDGRNAILKADTLLYGGKYSCAVWTAFAKRGMGANASEGSSNSTTDQKTDFTVPANACLLPVVWGNFTATKEGRHSVLNWNIVQEINSSKYIVQRSSDGINFTTIGTVAAAGNGNSVTANNYSFTDGAPLSGNDMYRIQQVDKNGNYTYSVIRILNFTGARTITISPNPAKDKLNVTITDNTQSLKLYFVNAQGQTVQQYTMTGQYQQLNLPQLSAGVYYLKIVDTDGSVTTNKVVIQ